MRASATAALDLIPYVATKDVRAARGRRAAEQRDELAPFHTRCLPVLPTERIALLGTAGLLRCGISIQLMTAVGRVSRGIAGPNGGAQLYER